MTFSAMGDNNACIWGSMADTSDGELMAGMAADSLKKVILEASKSYEPLPAEYMGCTITWESSDQNVISEDGTITAPEEKTKVELTAHLTFGETKLDKTYNVTVRPE